MLGAALLAGTIRSVQMGTHAQIAEQVLVGQNTLWRLAGNLQFGSWVVTGDHSHRR